MAYGERNPRGVGGWLTFFVLAFAVYSVIAPVVRMIARLYRDPETAIFFGDH